MVQIGSIDNPVGGLWTLLGFLGHVPFLNVTTGLPTPTDTGIPFTSIVFQYDGVSNSPIAWGNLLAVANAFAGFAEIHGTYLDPNQNGDFTGLPDGYTKDELLAAMDDPANIKFDAKGNKYVTVPTKVLPLASLILGVAAQTGTTQLVKPFVDLLAPLARVIIDLGYDPNANPGVPRWLSLLPIAYIPNPIKLAFDLANGDRAGHPGLPQRPRIRRIRRPGRTRACAVDDLDVGRPFDRAGGGCARGRRIGESGQRDRVGVGEEVDARRDRAAPRPRPRRSTSRMPSRPRARKSRLPLRSPRRPRRRRRWRRPRRWNQARGDDEAARRRRSPSRRRSPRRRPSRRDDQAGHDQAGRVDQALGHEAVGHLRGGQERRQEGREQGRRQGPTSSKDADATAACARRSRIRSDAGLPKARRRFERASRRVGGG